MTVLHEGRHPVAFIMSEADGDLSRENITIGPEQDIEPGQLLGAKVIPADATADAVAAIGNTGNATIAMDGTAPLTSKAKNGRYKGIAITATTVRWEDPDGKEIGTSTHGTAFAKGGVKFTITAGGTASVAGDEFFIDVGVEAPGDLQYVAFDPDGTDGSETVRAIAMYPAKTGPGETTRISAFVRLGTVNGHELVLPEGITAAQTVQAYADLAQAHVVVRN